MLEVVPSIPWPFYPAIIAFGVASVLLVISSQNVDYQKWEQLKRTSPGHPLAGRVGSEILTARGVRLFGWFFVAGGIAILSLLLGYVVNAYK